MCAIFGNDRKTSEYAESPTDAVENIAREELNQQAVDIEDDIPDDDLEGMDFSMAGTQTSDVGASGSTPRMTRKRKGRLFKKQLMKSWIELQIS